MVRQKIDVTSSWGEAIGYSRAVRAGDLIFVSGTTASGPDGKALHPGDAGAQAAEILQRIAAALKELGAGPEHVVETRIYLADITTWEAVGRAHGAMFKTTRPATVILEVSKLIAPDLLVEIAATASLVAG
jgi:enamine deaminase RidA (YjgF/YER057c/UK114 family)